MFLLIRSTMSTFINVLKEAGTKDHVFLKSLTIFLSLKENHLDHSECQSSIDLKKLETCIFTVKFNLEQLLKIKPSLFFHQEDKLLSKKFIMPRMRDFHSLWLDKMLNLKWKELMKTMPKEVISFATISITAKKLMNSRPQSTFLKSHKLKNWCLQVMNVFYICMPLLNKYKSSRLKQNMILKQRKISVQLS